MRLRRIHANLVVCFINQVGNLRKIAIAIQGFSQTKEWSFAVEDDRAVNQVEQRWRLRNLLAEHRDVRSADSDVTCKPGLLDEVRQCHRREHLSHRRNRDADDVRSFARDVRNDSAPKNVEENIVSGIARWHLASDDCYPPAQPVDNSGDRVAPGRTATKPRRVIAR